MRIRTSSTGCTVFVTLILATLASGGCGGGGSGNDSGGVGDGPSGSQAPDEAADEVADEVADGVSDDEPTSDPSAADFPFSGTFVVDEYSPSVVSPEYEGIVEIVPSPLRKTRILNGNLPRRYPDGRTTFREPCGQRVSRIALADSDNLSTPITPCSGEIPNDGASPTDFRQSNLSPDGRMVAVEARAFIDSGYAFSTMVFDITSQEVLADWDGGYNATWTPDGRLLMAASDGLYLLDADLDNPERIGDEITGPVGNPDVSQDGTAIVFEFNQQIWGMNLDGSGARELVTGGVRFRFPTWAPDGSLTIAYLAVPSDDKYYGIVFVADLEASREYSLVLDPVLEFGSSYFLRTINGPLSWNP